MAGGALVMLRSGQVIALAGLAMAGLAATGYAGAMSCRGFYWFACFFHTVCWLLGAQVPAALLQGIGLWRLPKAARNRSSVALFWVSATVLAMVATAWLLVAGATALGGDVPATP